MVRIGVKRYEKTSEFKFHWFSKYYSIDLFNLSLNRIFMAM